MKKLLILILCLFLLTSCKSLTFTNNPVEELSPYEILAKNYYVSLGLLQFNENEIVQVDKLIPYFQINEMSDGTELIKPDLKKYKTNNGNCEIMIPKEIVNEYLIRRFLVTLDDSESQYYPAGRTDVYILETEVRDSLFVRCSNSKFEGNRIIMDCESGTDNIDNGKVTYKFQICIENYDNDNFKYIYCKKIDI